ncbi:hypothetical protein evm_014743 [Chilo suppressalis]|nr:hypothetical protein evm_014743 [Chilo suppressalis]
MINKQFLINRVNFKKNEKTYDAEKSAVFKVLQEAENDPEPVEVAPSGAPPVSGLRHVPAPVTRPDAPINNTGGLPPGQNICEECERLITGVFVRIKDKNLHVECFKCSTCGTSLKNQGYYNLNGKLYCDIHAKLVARQNPPAPNLDPVTVPPGGRLPTNAYSTPLPPLSTNNYTNGSSSLFSPSSNLSGPKPFGSSIGSAYSPSLSPRSAPMSPARPVAAPVAAPAPAPTLAPVAPFAPKVPVSLFKGSSVGAAARGKTFGVSSAPKRGRGVLNKAALPGSRVPLCASCNGNIRGPFITALGRIWCPEHFICVNASCRRPLQDIGFVEENGQLYCEYCFEQYIAPACDKCHAKIKGDCLNAIGKHFHPECFNCVYCGKLFGNNPFFLEDGLPYCEADWNELFTTKCYACGFPVEAGDRWVEALNNNYHSQCFNCTVCKKNLEGQSFFAKGGRPFSPETPSPQRTRKLETPLHFDGGLFSDIRSKDGKLLSKVTVDRLHSSTRHDITDSPSVFESIGSHGNRDYVNDVVKTETITNEDVIKVKFTPVPPEIDSPRLLTPSQFHVSKTKTPVEYLKDDYEDLQSYKIVSSLCKEKQFETDITKIKEKSFDHMVASEPLKRSHSPLTNFLVPEQLCKEKQFETDIAKIKEKSFDHLVAYEPLKRSHSPLANFLVPKQMTKIDTYLQESLDACLPSEDRKLITPIHVKLEGDTTLESKETLKRETKEETYTMESFGSYQVERKVNTYQTVSEETHNPDISAKPTDEIVSKNIIKINSVKENQGVLRAIYNMPIHYHAAILCFILIVYNLIFQYIKKNCHGQK